MNSTEAKITLRILRASETAPTFRKAIETAAWDMLQEARELGWPERTQRGMVQAVINVGINMAEQAVAYGKEA